MQISNRVRVYIRLLYSYNLRSFDCSPSAHPPNVLWKIHRVWFALSMRPDPQLLRSVQQGNSIAIEALSYEAIGICCKVHVPVSSHQYRLYAVYTARVPVTTFVLYVSMPLNIIPKKLYTSRRIHLGT